MAPGLTEPGLEHPFLDFKSLFSYTSSAFSSLAMKRHQWYSLKCGHSQHSVGENSGIEPGDTGSKHMSVLD